MPQQIWAQRVLIAAVIAGASYMIPVLACWKGPAIIMWKGLGVGLLALYAALTGGNRDTRQIALVMALGAAGDVVLDIAFTAGAALFALGHLVAIQLYWRNRAVPLSSHHAVLALVLAISVPAMAWAMTQQVPVAGYALVLGVMVATAWASRFPHRSVGLGAILFAVSDLLIFARMGPLASSTLPHVLIWPLYFGGQALIAGGVVRARLS
ncbi:MAG: lysoplasmalogenase [Alphaproteobacteria bacterium]|nr:lysoplasmalogenase [Alphaproteobacteria bacterium]